VEGQRADCDLGGDGVLQVTVSPPQGQAGRPSSDRILHQVGQAFVSGRN